MNKSYQNWIESINQQIDFYKKGCSKNRIDNEFDWERWKSSEGYHEKILRKFPTLYSWARALSGKKYSRIYSKQWFIEKADLLWNSRQLLEDDLSKHLFDCHLMLKFTDPTRYLYPRIDFNDFIKIIKEQDFIHDELPQVYSSFQLKLFNVHLNENELCPELKIVSPKITLELLNRYRQYFISRGDISFIPKKGEIVFDCGACVGEISTIFAGLVGPTGQVHTFDPIPLHSHFIKLHADLNSTLTKTFHINVLAVDKVSNKKTGIVKDASIISPSGLVIDNFDSTSLDDYVINNNVPNVDYIKMDIEGFEISALEGSSRILKNFKPRLAISAYHKTEDLWEIPILIKKLNPNYKLYFGHHSPIKWESVYYAI